MNRNLNANHNENPLNSNENGRIAKQEYSQDYLNMKTYNNLFSKIISMENLTLAWQKARKGKTTKEYVIEFEKNTEKNLLDLHFELKEGTYSPKPLKTFILRDPKTRKISKSDFRDRLVHHAVVQVIEPIFDKTFIYDSCANRKGKGNLFALKRFDFFKRKVTKNNSQNAFCLKADIKHYFQEVDHEILLNILTNKLRDKETILLIKKILSNVAILGGGEDQQFKGMPLGNLTSQFFANVYLNKLDYFVKHKLRTKYYVRYVDDFVILHSSKSQLEVWKQEISNFLNKELKLELHPEKSRIISLLRGVDFVGFRNSVSFRLLRKRNIRKIRIKIIQFKKGETEFTALFDSFQGWQAYAKWANTYNLRESIKKEIISTVWDKITFE